MANQSRQLYQTFIRKGMQKEDAFFAVLDHLNDLHWHDRDQYGAEVKRLTEENKQLKARMANLETGKDTE